MIEVLNEQLLKIDILRKYSFLQREEKFREIGTFKIIINLEKENLYLLDRERTFYVLFDGKSFGVVTSIERTSDNEIVKQATISGRLAFNLFNERVISGTVNFKGKTYEMVKTLIERELGNEKEAERYVNIEINVKDEEYLKTFCSDVEKQVTGGYLWSELQTLLEQDKLGLFFKPKITTRPLRTEVQTNISGWSLEITAGVDRTKGNKKGNKPVIFSQSLSNIEKTDYTYDLSGYKNIAYVAGEGEGEERKWFEVEAPTEQTKQSGWNRKELWIDARDIQSEKDGEEITEEEYEKLIVQRANEKFVDSEKATSYSATIVQKNKQYKYGTDYMLGDLVTVIDEELGITANVQITSVTYSFDGKVSNDEIVDVSFTYGKISRDPVEQIGQVGDSSVENANNIKYLENKISNIDKRAEKTKDYVVEQNFTSKGWYRKWNSGLLEQWGQVTYAATTKTVQTQTVSFPISFKDTTYFMQLALSNNGTVATRISESNSGGSSERQTWGCVTRVDKTTGNYSIRANWYVAGRWK